MSLLIWAMAFCPAAVGSAITCHSAAPPSPVRQKVNPGGAVPGCIAAMSIWVAF